MGTRRERVILDLEDHLSGGMLKAAASTGLLNRELHSLSRDSVQTRRAVSDIDRPIQDVGRSSNTSSREVDKLSGRMRILADAAAILGPALIPIAAVGIPAVAGMAAQLGFAAAGAGTMILAFQGVGDTLKALNAAALDPTRANLDKAEMSLERLSPAARGFVAELGKMIPEWRNLRDVAAEGLFPGATEGLRSMETALPHVRGLIAAVSDELGTIAADTGASLASPRWTDFLDFLSRNAPQALGEMAHAAGNTAHAVAALWMATDPLNDDFSHWLVEATQRVDEFASGVTKTQGYADFITYVEENGPQVAETLGAVANAALQIAEAASPLGGPALKGIEAMANLVADVANSDLGTPIFASVAALALLNRTIAITGALQKKTFGGPAVAAFRQSRTGIQGMIADYRVLRTEQARMRDVSQNMVPVPLFRKGSAEAERLTGKIKTLGKSAAGVAGLAVATTGVADGLGLSNTASLALMGTIGGPWGAAIGGGIGLTLDLAHANDDLEAAIKRVNVAARSGDLTVMRDGIADLQSRVDDLKHTTGVGDFFSDVGKKIGSAWSNPTKPFAGRAEQRKAENAIANAEAEDATRRAAAAQQILADGFLATSRGIDTATQSTREFKNGIQGLNDTLAGRASLRDYEQAIDDFTDRQKKRAKVLTEIGTENADYAAQVANTDRDLAAARAKGDKGRVADLVAQRAQEKAAHDQRIKDMQAEADTLKNSLDIGVQAGRDTQALLDNIVATGVKFAESITNPVKRAEFLAGVRTQLIATAKQAGYGKEQLDELLKKFDELNTAKGEVTVVVDADGAFRVIDLVAARLERLTRKTHRINIEAQAANILPQVLDAQSHADGGTVRGPRYPYGDKVLTFLAPTEEVITNRHGEADQFRADRAAGRIPAYGNGGTVMPPSTAPTSAPLIDYDRLARAMSAVRPLYGDVHVTDGYGGFKKSMEADRRLAGLDGRRP